MITYMLDQLHYPIKRFLFLLFFVSCVLSAFQFVNSIQTANRRRKSDRWRKSVLTEFHTIMRFIQYDLIKAFNFVVSCMIDRFECKFIAGGEHCECFYLEKSFTGFPQLIANLGLSDREMNFQLHIERLHSFFSSARRARHRVC